MADAKRDANRVPTLLGVSNVDGTTPVIIYADPVTHRLLVDSTGGGSSPLTTKGDIYGYSTTDARIPVGTDGQVLTADSAQALGVKWATVTGTGTVTTVSVVSANGFAGSVANATTTPAITLTTSINSPVLAGDGTAILAATTTGSGSTVVLATSPTLVTPVLGVATATSINKVAITAPATGSTLTIADGKTLTASNTLTFTGTDSSSVAFGAGGTVAYTANKLSDFAATTSAELAGVISDETGTGLLVFGTAPTLASTVTIGTAGGTTGAALFKGTTSGTVTLSVADVAGTWTMKLPTSAGTSGYVLQTDGSGNTSWVAQSGGGGTPGGSSGQFQYNNAGSFGGTAGVVYAGSANIVTITAPASTDVPLVLKGAASQSANILEIQNSSSAKKLEVLDTGTMYLNRVSGTDYERLTFDFSTTTAAIKTEVGGSGTARALQITGANGLSLISSSSTLTLVSGGQTLSIVGSAAGFDWNNLAGGIRIYANGNSDKITMRSPLYLGDGSTGGLVYARDNFTFRSASGILWSSTSDPLATVDLGFKRSAANVAIVTDGSTGIGKALTARLVEANTAGSGSPNIIAATESRTLFTNEGATAENYETLPTAVAGLEFVFIVQDSDGMRITANTGDTIRIGNTVSASAGYIDSTTIGNAVTLVAINATEWVATSVIGTWTIV